ncbi:MAG: glycosyltransferase family 1 protein [Actinobacteria bacterium]|nr:glycosyltransferase family 1 protein [Actinomycetota bacterium]
MTGPDGSGPTDRLDAEEAAVAYWRGVAASRRAEAARVQRRPLVRAAIAIDRRTRPAQDRIAAASGRARAAVDRLRVRVARGLGPAPVPTRPAAVGSDGADAGAVEVRRLDEEHHERPGDPAGVVVLIAPGVDPDQAWIDPLVAALDRPDVAAALPCSLLPGGAGVRSAGSTIELHDGAPVPRALPAPDGDVATVDLAATGALAVRAADLVAIGGLDPRFATGADADAALADVGLRLAKAGRGSIVAVRGSVVVEPAPTRPIELRRRPAPDAPGWNRLVGQHGPALRRAALDAGHPVHRPTGWSIALTTATPSRKIADHSGDWHYAGCFADALARAGVDVLRQPISEAASIDGRARDVHLVLRGLEPVDRSPGQVHVLWVISHPEALTVAECDAADLVLVASERFAAHLARSTSTPVEVFEQATDPTRFRPDAANGRRSGTIVLANTRGVRRASVDAALASGHRPTIHGLGWDGLVEQDLIASSYVSYDDLPARYASSAVVLNDHWETMRLWGFVSNRILDATAAGAIVVSDHLPEIVERFAGTVPTWETPAELGALLDAIAEEPASFRERADQARAIVLDHHTFDHRVRELDGLLRRHGLHPAP